MTKRQLQSAAKRTLSAATSMITATLQEIHDLEMSTRETVARKLTLIGIALDEGAEVIASGHVPNLTDWREWARESVPGVSVGTVYRYRNAGTVARGIAARGGDIADVSYLAFVPFYRYLSAAKGDEEVESAWTAIMAGWATLTEGGAIPTADAATELVESAGVAATKGKSAGDSAKGAEDRKSAKGRKSAKSQKSDPPVEGSEDRDAAGSQLDTALARFADEPALVPIFLAGILAGVKLRETFSEGTVYAVTKQRVTAAKSAAKSAERAAA